ncbi:hypothetical protein ABZT03_42460 [Streptomyces sp. NPDC005574]|uniref:preATP grasp domain-containing protein n=1 Tax=Streptomyces sp. NPDC005574 TaxID=3156891 RepID=UPI0033A78633
MSKDPRAWAQRVFWFAQEGDVIILSDAPDQAFVQHVGRVKGIDMSKVRVHICPPGRYEARKLDPYAMLAPEFVASVAKDLKNVSEIFSLFPSAQLSEFAARLGMRDRLPGADFFAQGGSEMANSKATFRILAAAAEIASAPGTVCRSPYDAVQAMLWLLAQGHSVMVKKAHNGMGAGNEMVLSSGVEAPTNVGAQHMYRLAAEADAVTRYWKERWAWASVDGKYPVVVEALLSTVATYYAEFLVRDAGVELGGVGCLSFTEGLVAPRETVPAHGLPDLQRRALVLGAEALARSYHALGYRGHLCADAVATTDGEIVFTEVNARTTTSTHLYSVIADQVIDLPTDEDYLLRQLYHPLAWNTPTTEAFLDAINDAGLAYDPKRRKGILMSMPVVPGNGGCLLVIASGGDDEEEAYLRRLNALFEDAPMAAT